MPSEPHWIVTLIIGLIPQKDDDTVKLYWWRWRSVVLGLVCLALSLYADGWLPFVPSPYVQAHVLDDAKSEFQSKSDDTNKKLDKMTQEVGDIKSQLRDGQIRQLNNDLIDARRYQCRAINSADKSALPFWDHRIQELKFQFTQLTTTVWDDLPCNSF